MFQHIQQKIQKQPDFQLWLYLKKNFFKFDKTASSDIFVDFQILSGSNSESVNVQCPTAISTISNANSFCFLRYLRWSFARQFSLHSIMTLLLTFSPLSIRKTMTGHKNLFLLFSVTLVGSMLVLDQYQEDNPSDLILIPLLLLFKSKIAENLATLLG